MDILLIAVFVWSFFKMVNGISSKISLSETFTTLKCPNCQNKIKVECNENGTCPGCGQMKYDWDYLIDNGNDELEWTGFHWMKIEE